MENLSQYLPFLIPLAVLQFALLGYTLYHILTHHHYRRGNRTLWLIVTLGLTGFIGPILYLLLGREDA